MYTCVNGSSNVELFDERITSKQNIMAILTWLGADFSIRARLSNKHKNN